MYIMAKSGCLVDRIVSHNNTIFSLKKKNNVFDTRLAMVQLKGLNSQKLPR